jgi:hypothetical protein
MTRDREFLGKVTISTGEVVMYVPMLKDIIDVKFDDPQFVYKLMAASLSIPYEEFMEWNVPDVMKCFPLLNGMIEKL